MVRTPPNAQKLELSIRQPLNDRVALFQQPAERVSGWGWTSGMIQDWPTGSVARFGKNLATA